MASCPHFTNSLLISVPHAFCLILVVIILIQLDNILVQCRHCYLGMQTSTKWLFSTKAKIWRSIHTHLKQIIFSKNTIKIKHRCWAFYIVCFYFIFSLLLGGAMFPMSYIWRSEDNFVESVYFMGSKDWIQTMWQVSSPSEYLDSPGIHFFIYILISALINTGVTPVLFWSWLIFYQLP